MKTTIVCGLLGSGKTTFIKNFLRGSTEKAVVLVNDFGQAGIDGEIFSVDGIESIELPSGCVCCTLKFDLITTIEKILATLAPAHLLIEPSGVASPSGVLEVLELLKITPVTVIGIVDATEFIELHDSQMYGSFFEDQIVNSDILLVNKTDLAEEKRITETVALVGKMNPRAVTFRTVNAAFTEPLSDIRSGQRSIGRDIAHLRFDAASFRPARTVVFSSYKRFFEDMKNGVYGEIVRAKSLVNTDEGLFRFDLSFGIIDVAPFEALLGDNRLVVIGRNLNKESIQKELD